MQDGKLTIAAGLIEPEALAAYECGFDLRLCLELSRAISARRAAERLKAMKTPTAGSSADKGRKA